MNEDHSDTSQNAIRVMALLSAPASDPPLFELREALREIRINLPSIFNGDYREGSKAQAVAVDAWANLWAMLDHTTYGALLAAVRAERMDAFRVFMDARVGSKAEEFAKNYQIALANIIYRFYA